MNMQQEPEHDEEGTLLVAADMDFEAALDRLMLDLLGRDPTATVLKYVETLLTSYADEWNTAAMAERYRDFQGQVMTAWFASGEAMREVFMQLRPRPQE